MIRHRTARRIASEWHSEMLTGLYALCSSGAIIVNRSFTRNPATRTNDSGELVLSDDPDTLATLTAVDEINDDLNGRVPYPHPLTKRDTRDLVNLRDYCQHYGPRDAVEGWNRMRWD